MPLPDNVTAARACVNARVTIRIQRGKKRLATKEARLDSNCAYSKSFRLRASRRLGDATKVRVLARFQGNRVLLPRGWVVKNVRIR